MNWKWIIIMDEDPYFGKEAKKLGYYVFMYDREAMDFLFDHKEDWILLDVIKNPTWKGDLDQ